MCVLILSTTFVSNISHSKKNSARYYHKCTQVVMLHFYQTLIFPRDFRKILKYKISRKSLQWEPRCSMRAYGHTDRYDETKSRFLQYLTRLKTVQHSLPCTQAVPEFRSSISRNQRMNKTLLKGDSIQAPRERLFYYVLPFNTGEQMALQLLGAIGSHDLRGQVALVI